MREHIRRYFNPPPKIGKAKFPSLPDVVPVEGEYAITLYHWWSFFDYDPVKTFGVGWFELPQWLQNTLIVMLEYKRYYDFNDRLKDARHLPRLADLTRGGDDG